MGDKKNSSKKKKKEKLNSESFPQSNTAASQELAKQRNEVPDFEKLYAESPHGDDYTITFDF